MAVRHYENFPVASLLLPAALREPVEIIYRFARSADDFADEGDDPPQVRLRKLDDYRRQLAAPSTPRCAMSQKSFGNMSFRSSCSPTCSTRSRRT